MSKPLELTWYEQDEDGDYIHPAQYFISSIDVDYWVECKHLTEAELAAEFHYARADYEEASKHISLTYWTPLGVDEDATAEMALKRSVTMLRFASRPHHDEETP